MHRVDGQAELRGQAQEHVKEADRIRSAGKPKNDVIALPDQVMGVDRLTHSVDQHFRAPFLLYGLFWPCCFVDILPSPNVFFNRPVIFPDQQGHVGYVSALLLGIDTQAFPAFAPAARLRQLIPPAVFATIDP